MVRGRLQGWWCTAQAGPAAGALAGRLLAAAGSRPAGRRALHGAGRHCDVMGARQRGRAAGTCQLRGVHEAVALVLDQLGEAEQLGLAAGRLARRARRVAQLQRAQRQRLARAAQVARLRGRAAAGRVALRAQLAQAPAHGPWRGQGVPARAMARRSERPRRLCPRPAPAPELPPTDIQLPAPPSAGLLRQAQGGRQHWASTSPPSLPSSWESPSLACQARSACVDQVIRQPRPLDAAHACCARPPPRAARPRRRPARPAARGRRETGRPRPRPCAPPSERRR